MGTRSQPDSKQRAARWASAGLLIVVVLLVGLVLHGLSKGPQPGSNQAGEGADGARSAAGASPAVTPSMADEIPPWRTTTDPTKRLPPGTVPAWAVNPPPPDPSTPMPPDPVEPPNPAEHRPPLHNPGGVNSDRPERPVPGLD